MIVYQAGFSIDTEPPESGQMIMEADKSKDLQSGLETRRVGVNARNASPKLAGSRPRKSQCPSLKALRKEEFCYLGEGQGFLVYAALN